MGYPSDLTDEQWAIIEPVVTYKTEDELYKGGRPTTVDLRAIVNALLYMDRRGIQWRYFPSDFPPSGTIRYYFDKWTWDGTWEKNQYCNSRDDSSRRWTTVTANGRDYR